MRVAMIGTGYVGLVSGACFSEFGHEVTCVDKDAAKIEALQSGRIPIYEPGLETMVARNTAAGNLKFSTDLAAAVGEAEAVFIAVGTPSRRGDGHADLQYVYDAAKEIGRAIKGYTLVITKSTVPVGTGAAIDHILSEVTDQANYDVVSNPEFLREGSAIEDFLRPDRVVVGSNSERAKALMKELYRPLSLNQTPMVFTERTTSELIKYAANAFLATKITFINEMADLCERVGADVQDLARGMGLDNRIGGKFLNAGPGYGGSCFPKDTLALLKTAQDLRQPLKIVEATVLANINRKEKMVQKIIKACGGDVTGKSIAVLGVTFKPNTDDMREAPSLAILPKLQEAGASLSAYDPAGMEEAKKELQNISWKENSYEAIADADALVILTEWNEFRALDLGRVKALMRGNVIVDLRDIYDPVTVRELGFAYSSVGRP